MEVPETVIDIFEPIEIEEQNCEPLLGVAFRARKCVAQSVHQYRPVGEPREGVLEAGRSHRLSRLVLPVDVRLSTDDANRPIIGVFHDLAAGQHPAVIPTLRHHPISLLDHGDLTGDAGVDDRAQPRQIFGVDSVQPALEIVLDLVRRVAQHVFPAVREVDSLGGEV